MARDSVFDLEKRWFHVALPLRVCTLKDIATSTVTKAEMDELFEEAKRIVETEKTQSQLDRGRWYSTQFLSRGTTADRVASAAVKLSDTDFMFFLDGFNLLFDTARSDAHHYEAALRALSAVWAKTLPPRPLKKFVSQYFATLPQKDAAAPSNTSDLGKEDRSTDSHTAAAVAPLGKKSSQSHDAADKDRRTVLAYWYVEDYLKRTYAQFLSLCESMLADRVVQRRAAWLEVVAKMMCGVAEGRHSAMAMVLHKLGDSDGQIAHKAYHHLLKLLTESSTHQSQLFTELEKVVFAKGCPMRTMRYAVNVMNQLVFSKEERHLAMRCVQTYLMLFRQLALGGGVESTVATAIMVGLRRAFPYAGTDAHSLADHLNALFVIAHTGSFQQRVTTLSLLQLLVHTRGTADTFQSRWYRALYQMLLISPKQVPQAAQLTTLFTMLHRAMRSDRCEARVMAFVHRLLQRSLYFHEAVVCAVLLLVSEVAQARPAVRALLRQPAWVSSSSPSSQNRVQHKPKDFLGTHKAGGESAGNDATKEAKLYDPKAREPQHARAAQTSLWTLGLLTRHPHPVVVRLAVLLLLGEEMVFDMHPLDDMTLANFLHMFVDAKTRDGGHVSSSSEAHGSTGTGATAAHLRPGESGSGGVSVFRRAVHLTSLPSVSDPSFCQADARDVDVGALFMHRYAVQRQRFLDSLSQVRSSWGGDGSVVTAAGLGEVGDGEGYDDAAAAGRVVKVDSALFGPGGVLASVAGDDECATAQDNRPVVSHRHSPTRAAVEEEEEEEDEDDLAWGADMDDEEDESDAMVESGEDDVNEEEEENDEVLGAKSHRRGAGTEAEEDGGDDFAAVMEQHKQVMSKRQRREEKWLDSRSAPVRPSSSAHAPRWSRGGGSGRGNAHVRGRGRGRGGRASARFGSG